MSAAEWETSKELDQFMIVYGSHMKMGQKKAR